VHFAVESQNDAQADRGFRCRQAHDEKGDYLPYNGVWGETPVKGHEIQVGRIEQEFDRNQHPDQVPALEYSQKAK
jgi:hypothetical protein